jgi:hypothetical protein
MAKAVARIEATTHVEAPPEAVWAALVDWENQPRWMVDARSAVVLSPQREGSGVVLRCRTDILGGIVVTDDLTVTDWDKPRMLGVRHLGALIRGVGTFELSSTPHGTCVVWWEEAAVPLGGVGDALATALAVPGLQRVFRRSLAALKRICESDSVGP